MEPEVEGMMLFYHTHVRRAREEREPVVPTMLSSTAKVAVCIVQGQDARCVVVEQVEQPASLFVEHLPQPVGDGVNLLQPFLYNT